MDDFWNKFSDIKLIENKDNVETYEANMRISIKKLKAKDEYELLIYKQKLISNKIDFKIYDIIEDDKNKILNIIYDPNQDINELLNSNLIHIYKEAIIEGHSSPITKNEILKLFEKDNSMCKIYCKRIIDNKLEDLKASGFFLEFKDKEIPFNKCLITNNHILDKKSIQRNKEIKIIHKNEEKKIIIAEERKVFTDEELDYTCIEILKKDNIKEDFFKIDINILENNPSIFEEQDIFILQFPEGKDLSFSSGKILKVKDSKMLHNCSTRVGSSGSPIISRNSDFSIIGLHYGSFEKKKDGGKLNSKNCFNLCTTIVSIINDMKNKLKYYKNCNIEQINKQDNYINNDNEYNLDFKTNSPYIKDNFAFTPLIGLQNINAAHYMNATLQCFCHIDYFVNKFKYSQKIINKIKNNKKNYHLNY